jgi:hypothetical protein
MKHLQSRATSVKYVLAGGSVLAALGLLMDPHGAMPTSAASRNACQELVQSQAVLSREQLSRLLTVPERSSRLQVRQVIPEPYCKFSDVQIRAGATAQREAYPLTFDSQTWLVVLYEGNEYAGYDFSFRR